VTLGLDQPTRLVRFDSLFNVRDLGGYRTADGGLTRWRTLFRADGLNRAEGDDLARLSAMGLRTVIDLRTPDEAVERGRFPVEHLPVTYHHFPVLQQTWESVAIDPGTDGSAFLASRYLEMLDTRCAPTWSSRPRPESALRGSDGQPGPDDPAGAAPPPVQSIDGPWPIGVTVRRVSSLSMAVTGWGGLKK
jgi:Tyrosine phosphatase family